MFRYVGSVRFRYALRLHLPHPPRHAVHVDRDADPPALAVVDQKPLRVVLARGEVRVLEPFPRRAFFRLSVKCTSTK